MVRLILVRHGQSIWNKENRFTGWEDIPLTIKGLNEAKKAGKLLKNYSFDEVFTSELMRANQTLYEILNQNKSDKKYYKIHTEENKELYNKFISKKEKEYVKINFSSNLNERHYGDLQGLNKDDTRKKYGKEQVHIWRRSYDIAPPSGESLKDTYKRAVPYFNKKIKPLLKKDKNVLIVAHGNSLRAIIKYLEKISDKDIPNIELETGVPIVYYFKDLEITQKRKLKFSTNK